MGVEVASQLVRAFTGGDSGDLGVAVALHAEVTAAGRKQNTNASIQLSTSLLKRRRLHEAAEVLLQMALKDRRRSPGYVLSMVAQRHRALRAAADRLPDDEEREKLDALLGRVQRRFGIDELEDDAPGPDVGRAPIEVDAR